MDIGKLIHQRRKELNLTLEEVGHAVGVVKSTVKKWEDGYIANMRRDKIVALSTILKIDPIHFIDSNSVFLTDDTLTTHEKTLISAYRSQPDLQKAVDRLLGINNVTRG